MPLKKDLLLEELAFTRDEIIAQTYHQKGYIPDICNDQALLEISKKKPTKSNDFKAIQGLNDAFIEHYADRFLNVINKHKYQSINEVHVSKIAKKTLHEYQDRLTNLSRRNRNIYTPRLSQRNAVDLYQEQLSDTIIKFLSNPRQKKIKLTNFTESESKDSFYRSLVVLNREIKRTAIEKGTYNLFIAYPFVEGRLPKDDFYIKAPLMFFPVLLERKGYDYYLIKNTENDILINRDLILANHKINQFKEIDNPPTIDPFSIQDFNKIILEYYKKHHILIKGELNPKQPIESFESITLNQLPKTTSKNLTLKPNLLLGKFSMYTSHIQEDISRIIQRKSYNDLLDTLIDRPFQLYDHKHSLPFQQVDHTTLKENQLNYINQVNYAQEKVLSLIDQNDQLVIWGPPGTGKSQTITNIIAHQISKKENVLIVSEKKVALDVILRRLGSGAKHTLFIDDAQDKNHFYNQIKECIDPQPPVRTQNNDRYTIDYQIEEKVDKLRNIQETFYKPNGSDIEPYTIYPRYLKEKDIIENLQPEVVFKIIKNRFKNPTFEDLNTLEVTFNDKKKFKAVLLYTQFIQSYPLLKHINIKLTRTQKHKRNVLLTTLEQEIEKYDKVNFFQRKRKINKYIRNEYKNIDYLFEKPKYRKKLLKYLLKDPALIEIIRQHHSYFERYKEYHESLNTLEKNYIDLIRHNEPFKNIIDMENHHTDIFDSYYTGYIEIFEALNQSRVEDLEDYQKHIEELNKLINTKEAMNIDNFKMDLYQEALNLSNTKRIMNIKRQLESKRKKSVKQFIDEYQLELFTHLRVWLMTPEVVSEILPLNYAMFDLVVFDEASQLYVEKAIPTIYRAKKVVIAGDTKQLRPSSLGTGRFDVVDEFEDEPIPITKDAESLLDLARYRYPETILNYHYRSNFEELIAFSNFAFYDGKLMISPNVKEERKPPIEYIVVEEGIWDNRRNLKEAEKVVEIVKKILRTRKNQESIGIITFNIQQRSLIEDLLDEEIFKNNRYSLKIQKELNRFDGDEDQSLFVKNIENVQGDERDIIIFSSGYAKNKEGRFLRQFGWLNNEGGQNRLNVAISRAKRKIYFITSFYPETFRVEDLKGEGPKLLKRYMEYAYAISENDKERAAKILNALNPKEEFLKVPPQSVLLDAIEKRLNGLDYKIEKNIGIGGYTIDFALIDTTLKSRVLGIICEDHRTNLNDVRDQYYHQEKYLQSRGWQIYHIFGPNWFKDPNKEMRQIRKLLRN